MHIYKLSFLLFFLPAVLLVFSLAKTGKSRVKILFLASLCFMATISWFGLGIMLASVWIDYRFARLIFLYGRENWKGRASLFFCAAKSILLFILLSSFSGLGWMEMPVGVAVYCFTSLGYLTDLYQGETDLATSFWQYGLFCCFFGKLYVGPILSYDAFAAQLRELSPTPAQTRKGITWLLFGLAKKVILADSMMGLALQLSSIPTKEKTVVSVWMFIACEIFAVYYTLSGFSDMARGVGAVFGIELPENFHYPLQADSVTDFFSRFNMSAYRFVRKYIYQNLGAEDNGKMSTTVNIILITMIMGLWYGIRLNYLVWGVFLGLFIVLETLYEEFFFQKMPRLLRHLYTIVAIIVSFAWYSSYSLGQAGFYLKAMFGLNRTMGLINDNCLYLIGSNWLLIVCCIIFCTSQTSALGKRFAMRCPKAARVGAVLRNLMMGVLLIAWML